jgi:hypothetical protein
MAAVPLGGPARSTSFPRFIVQEFIVPVGVPFNINDADNTIQQLVRQENLRPDQLMFVSLRDGAGNMVSTPASRVDNFMGINWHATRAALILQNLVTVHTTSSANFGAPVGLYVHWADDDDRAGRGGNFDYEGVTQNGRFNPKKGVGAKAVIQIFDHDNENLCAPTALEMIAMRYDSKQAMEAIRRKYENRLPATKIIQFINEKLSTDIEESEKTFLNEKKSMISIWNTCSRLQSAKSESSKNTRIRRQRAHKLTVLAGYNPNEFNGANYEHLSQFAKTLSEVREKVCAILVFEYVHDTLILRFTTRDSAHIEEHPEAVDEFYFLLRTEDENEQVHYDALLHVNGLIRGQKYFCPECTTGYSNYHRCTLRCSACKEYPNHARQFRLQNKTDEDLLKCEACDHQFFSNHCLRNHVQNGVCHDHWKCPSCLMTFVSQTDSKWKNQSKRAVDRDNHVCGRTWCANCFEWVETWPEHQCYIKRKKPKTPSEKLLFADFEATQDEEGGLHKVNLCVTYDFDGAEWPVFKTTTDWISHLLHGDTYEDYTVIFHNGQGYDFQFILLEAIRQERNIVSIKMNGTKIKEFFITRKLTSNTKKAIRFIDSLCFLMMPLQKFSATFGLETQKGYYPHFFNTRANENYVGDVPTKDMFGYSSMTKGAKKKFDAWYAERLTEGPWDNAKELLYYCRKDVELLREGCLKFRSIVMDVTDAPGVDGCVDPFTYTTIASCAMAYFKAFHMTEESVCTLTHFATDVLKRAFYGGRTGCSYVYWKKKNEDERADYVDFTSLYPYINSNGLYPIGRCEQLTPLTTDQEEIRKIVERPGLSIIFCNVFWPKDREPLFHPLLPEKKDGKLIFDLQYKFNAGYTNLELQKALQLGYVIEKIHSVFHWELVSDHFFKEYIKKFLKLKQEAAGWPRQGMSVEEKEKYIKEYELSEGIRLDKQAIQDTKNAGMYNTAKLFLNSEWGKWGERMKHEYIATKILRPSEQDAKVWYQHKARNEIHNWRAIGDRSVLLNVKPNFRIKSSDVVTDKNITIAIFTTAQARLKLYNDFLEPLQKRVLYYDTDSVIYKTTRGQKMIELGPKLGDPTNELGHYGNGDYEYGDAHIVEFFSGGPKNYGYKVSTGDVSLKCKGISLNRGDVQDQLGYEQAKMCVLQKESIVINTSNIKREDIGLLVTEKQTKTYRPTISKRKVQEYDSSNIPDQIVTYPWQDDDKEAYLKIQKELKQASKEQQKKWKANRLRQDEIVEPANVYRKKRRLQYR